MLDSLAWVQMMMIMMKMMTMMMIMTMMMLDSLGWVQMIRRLPAARCRGTEPLSAQIRVSKMEDTKYFQELEKKSFQLAWFSALLMATAERVLTKLL